MKRRKRMESYRVRKERQGEEWRRTEQGKTDNVCKAPKGIFYNGNSESLGILRKEGKP